MAMKCFANHGDFIGVMISSVRIRTSAGAPHTHTPHEKRNLRGYQGGRWTQQFVRTGRAEAVVTVTSAT